VEYPHKDSVEWFKSRGWKPIEWSTGYERNLWISANRPYAAFRKNFDTVREGLIEGSSIVDVQETDQEGSHIYAFYTKDSKRNGAHTYYYGWGCLQVVYGIQLSELQCIQALHNLMKAGKISKEDLQDCLKQ
jgi:hypothetical protein